jgi:hypothetical protein
MAFDFDRRISADLLEDQPANVSARCLARGAVVELTTSLAKLSAAGGTRSAAHVLADDLATEPRQELAWVSLRRLADSG